MQQQLTAAELERLLWLRPAREYAIEREFRELVLQRLGEYDAARLREMSDDWIEGCYDSTVRGRARALSQGTLT